MIAHFTRRIGSPPPADLIRVAVALAGFALALTMFAGVMP